MISRDIVRNMERIPVKDSQRIRTDVICILCNSLFVLVLFIISIATYSKSALIKMSLPNDSEGNVCGYQQTANFTILYYPDIKNPVTVKVIQFKRVCVARCPIKNAKNVDCFETNKTSCQSFLPVQTDSIFQQTRQGLFCFPTDSEQKKILLENVGLSRRYHGMGVYDAIWRSFYISSIFAIVFVILVQFFPNKVVPWTIVFGGVFSTLFGFLVMILTTGSIFFRILFFLISVGLTAGCGYTLFVPERMRQLFVYSKLIEASSIVLKQNLLTILYVPFFIGLLFILLVLAGFQVLAAWSFSKLVFQDNYPFYQLKGVGSSFFHFLVLIEFIWGLCFLKQAANFCVSGVATQWYFYKTNNPSEIKFYRSLLNIIRYHWGSVLGCAILTATLYIFDYIFDFFLNVDTDVKKEDAKFYQSLDQQKAYQEQNGFFDFFNLCRSETMSYINLVCIPYCNAARYCEQLSTCSHFFDYSQSTSRTYRLAAHILIASLVIFISVMIVKQYSGISQIQDIFYISLTTLFTITFFIGLHGDMAEGLLISVFVEGGYLTQKSSSVRLVIPPEIIKQIYQDDVRQIYHNKTLKNLLFD